MSHEIEGVLKDVLVKEVGGNMHDKVFIVNELPRSLFYTTAPKMIPKIDRDGYPTGDMVPDLKNKQEVLKEGITLSQAGDNGYVFDCSTNAGRAELEVVDRYISSMLPASVRPAPREFYCSEPGNYTSPPRPLHQLPRVELPVSSPPVEESSSMVQASPSTLKEAPKKRRGRPAKVK